MRLLPPVRFALRRIATLLTVVAVLAVSGNRVLRATHAEGLPTAPIVDANAADSADIAAWKLVYARPATGKYEDLAFPDSMNGWLISAAGYILHTTDGGTTWVEQAKGYPRIRSIDFIDAKRGFAGALTGKLIATTDGGQTWNDITATLPQQGRGFCGMTHVGVEMHIVGAYAGKITDYFYSPDAGKTWKHTDLSTYADGLVDVSFINRNVGFIGGMAHGARPGEGPALILKTTDGGKNWKPVFQHSGGRGFAWKIFPINEKMIYAALQSQDGVYRVAKSTDSGEHWDTLTVATGKPQGPGVQGIGFIDANTGWVGGFFRGLYTTNDGGKSWREVPLTDGTFNRFERVGNSLITAATRGVMKYSAPAVKARR